jgi:hypothetical protein
MPAGVQLQALRAQRHLLAGFLAGDVERRMPAGQLRQRLQQQGRFADARIAADQHHAARPPGPPPSTRSNSSMPVAMRVSSRGLISARRCSLPLPAMAEKRLVGAASARDFHQGVPGVAVRALALPLGRLPPHSVQA